MGEPLSWKETIDMIIHQIRIDFNVTENMAQSQNLWDLGFLT